MPKLLQINTVINSGSTGHIAEGIGKLVMRNGWESYIAFGRNPRQSSSKAMRIGSKLSVYFHVFLTRLFDRHGFGSFLATRKLVKQIESLKPDVIHLHNIHGYYLNIRLLFNYLKKNDRPVVWTLHDCWSFTGHCSHYTAVACDRWKSACFNCPQRKQYPKSFTDNSRNNYKSKKNIFYGLKNLTLVTPSKWLADELQKSFLKDYTVDVIHNGIDLEIFKLLEDNNSLQRDDEKIILGVASTWTERKGLNDFIELSKKISSDEKIVLIGVTESQKKSLPWNVTGISRTENQQQLVEWYNRALCFLNLTYEDTFPTTNIESLACGTPVITYRTGGSPEIIDENTGFVTEAGDVGSVYECIQKIRQTGKSEFVSKCRGRAEQYFSEEKNFEKYLNLYNALIR